MKRTALILGLIVILSSPVFAASLEYPYLYKSPRAMGMGGAYVAIGGSVDTLFYNPAGLSGMPEKNWEINFGRLEFGFGKNVIDFSKDMGDAFDTEDLNGDGDSSDDQLKAVNDVLAEYRGRNLHFRLSELTSLGKNNGKKAFGLGSVFSLRVDAMTHQGFGTDGLFELNSDTSIGIISGMSYKVMDDLYLGASLKYLRKETLIHNFTARELVENQETLEDYITEDLKKSGGAVGFDVGGIYKFLQDSWFRPAVGLSLLNIGDMDFGEAGKIPMTVNLGLSMNPKEIPVFKALKVGFDYADLLGNYGQDSDIAKRLRFGGEVKVFDRLPASMVVRAGLYQGYPTFGTDLRLLLLTLSYTTYAEEIGAYAGQDKDRRHLISLALGW